MIIREIGKLILFFGFLFVLVGVVLLLLGRLPFLGKLPGDLYIQRRGFSLYFPLTTCLLVSVILTILVRLFFRK